MLVGRKHNISVRPDLAILCYPVITMEPIGHSGSRNNLAGKTAPAELLEKLSTEKALWQAGLICLMLG